MTDQLAKLARYLKEEGFIDRSRNNPVAELEKLKGKPVSEWLDPVLMADNEGNEGQKRLYDAVAEVLGGLPVYEWLKSRRYLAHCWALEQTLELVPMQPDFRILDVGCGSGLEACFFAEYISPQGNVTGIDISPRMIGFARARAARRHLKNTMFLVTNRDDPPNGQTVHLAFFNHSLTEGECQCRTPNDQTWFHYAAVARLQKVRQLLTPNGKIVVIQPSLPDSIDYTMGYSGSKIRGAGFAITKVRSENFTCTDPDGKTDHYSQVLFLAEPKE
jgi:SAM-dependent methyltransferase